MLTHEQQKDVLGIATALRRDIPDFMHFFEKMLGEIPLLALYGTLRGDHEFWCTTHARLIYQDLVRLYEKLYGVELDVAPVNDNSKRIRKL